MHIRGSAQFIPILIIGVVVMGLFAFVLPMLIGPKNLNNQNTQTMDPSFDSVLTPTEPINTPTPTLVPTATPTLAPTPTSTPMLLPTSIPTPAPIVHTGPPGTGHSRYTIATEKGNFLIDVISITGARMITDTASDGECGNECPTLPLADYIARNGAFAGMNGTYFCPTDYESCAGKTNSYDFPVYNSRLSRWINQGNLFWNNRSIFYKDGGGYQFKATAADFGGGLEAGLVNHPGLLDGGNVIAENFGQTEKQMTKGTKTGIGKNGQTVYLVVARNVNMVDLAHVFKSLGATHALNLDGGGSVALWYNGYKVGPGRNLPNAVVFAY